MAVNKVQYGNTTIIDLSQDTVASAADIVSGKVGHLRDGSVVTGTASAGGGGVMVVSINAEYDEQTETETYTSDKTFAEIEAAILAGKYVVVRESYSGESYVEYFTLLGYYPNAEPHTTVQFACTSVGMYEDGVVTTLLTIDSNDSITVTNHQYPPANNG